MREIGSYPWLDSAQVERLIALKLPQVNVRLIFNKAVKLDSKQLDDFLTGRHWQVLTSLVAHRWDSLTAEQQSVLLKDPNSAQRAALRAGGQLALDALATIVAKDDLSGLQGYLYSNPNPSAQAVDLVLEKGGAQLRSFMSMNSKVMYTPGQIDRMLRDPEHDVKIGVLRRKELAITREQFTQGVNHPNNDIAFWYRMREEYVPTADEIEKGLSNPDAPTRRGWLFDKRYKITAAQVDRAIKQNEVRGALLSRDDWTMTEAQMDACLKDPEVSHRFACVQRTDFLINQLRFEAIVMDWNQNVLNFFLNKSAERKQQVLPYIAAALQSQNRELILKIVRARDFEFTDAQVQAGMASKDREVRTEFCRRQPQPCS